MMPDWLTADMLTAIVAAAGLVVGVVSSLIRYLDAKSQARDKLRKEELDRRDKEHQKQIEQMLSLLRESHHQLYPNSGASMADKINRLDAWAEHMNSRLDQIIADLSHEREVRDRIDSELRDDLHSVASHTRSEHQNIHKALSSLQSELPSMGQSHGPARGPGAPPA